MVQNCRNIGIYSNFSFITVNDSVIRNNNQGIYNYGYGGTLVLNRSSVSGNVTPGSDGGGGIFYSLGSVILNNSTIGNNQAGHGGGVVVSSVTMEINNSTIVGNRASQGDGGGILSHYSTVTLTNSILAENTAYGTGQNCKGDVNSAGYNLIGDTSGCNFTPGAGDIITTVNARLGSLVGVAGIPRYYPLLTGSLAIDTGDPSGCMGSTGPLTTDQRGVLRVGHCDIGAYEYTPPGAAASIYAFSGTPQRAAPHTTFGLPFQVTVLDSIGTPVSDTLVTFSAPASGASGTFTDTDTYTTTSVTTESGFASAVSFTANYSTGTYTVTATVGDVVTPANFLLNNFAQAYLPLIAKPDPAAIVKEYPFTDRCMQFPVQYNGQDAARVNMCVTSVQIRVDGQMRFNVKWTVEFLTNAIDWVRKNSDVGNRNMYLTNNLGNRYDHVALGGAAANAVYFYRVGGPTTATGWYLFPPAGSGATVFAFHDDDQHTVIENIVLAP